MPAPQLLQLSTLAHPSAVMSAHLESVGNALRGDGGDGGSAQQAPGLDRLSQLSDIAQMDQAGGEARKQPRGRGGGGASVPMYSQSEQLIDAPNPLALQAPSQPDIPPPNLPPSAMDGAAPHGLPDDRATALAAAAAAGAGISLPAGDYAIPVNSQGLPTLDPTMLAVWNTTMHGLAAQHEEVGLDASPQPQATQPAAPQPGPRSRSGKPTRRGPMDEMRQLVRILVKVSSGGRPGFDRVQVGTGCCTLPLAAAAGPTVSVDSRLQAVHWPGSPPRFSAPTNRLWQSVSTHKPFDWLRCFGGCCCSAPLRHLQVLPHSLVHIGVTDESGGGNRISEEQIKSYLENTLGEAPRPQWGVSVLCLVVLYFVTARAWGSF